MREEAISDIGRVPVYEHQFDGDEFSALRAAEEWLENRGFSLGRLQAHAPTGIKRGYYDLSKWRNLRARERRTLDGCLVGDYRNGPVTLLLMVQP